MGWRVGVDIGGSFTDFAVLDGCSGAVRALKVFSRPDQPGAEILAGLAALEARHGIAAAEIGYFTHGTTVGVNTVIQRKGLRLALFTTRGFRDVLELARLRGPNMYDLLSKRPAPLIPRDLVFEIDGRLRADGGEEAPLDEAGVLAALAGAEAAGAEGIVVALLHAWRNPAQEDAALAILRWARPGLPVFGSAETWPIIREYERTITAVVGGYVQPRVAHYLGGLQAALREAGVAAEPRVTRSNGGVMTAEQGKRDCVQMILSGTASGVIGAGFIAGLCGLKECMSLDIGGTSADVALILDGQPQYGTGERIGEFQIHIPSVAVSSIGEGGGSIASVDSFGVLQVGPESAGSTPGPACFGCGGTRPTVTDAFAVCGMIGQAALGYSAVTVDAGKARDAVGGLAAQLGRGVEETAEAIIRIAVSGMYAKVSGIVTRFGVDPRAMALLAFGGAGPMLGGFLARELGMAETVVPPTPGVLSALGGLIADLRSDFIETLYVDLGPATAPLIREGFAGLRDRALRWLREEQGHTGPATLHHAAELRYRGQSYEIETRFDAAVAEAGDVVVILAAFHAEHARVYGHADPAAPVQLVSLRLVVVGRTPKPELPRLAATAGPPEPLGRHPVWLDGDWRDAPFYARAALRAGDRFAGPAVVVQEDCTSCIPPGFTVRVDDRGNLRLLLGAAT
jgi:N-methylhydantoinase A